MHSRREMKKMRFANAILMLACVGFVLTAQTAFATNESSYKVGFSIAIDQYDTNYYIGFQDGVGAVNKRIEISPPFMGHPKDHGGVGIECPTGHGTEYCIGYKAGWNAMAAFWA